MNGVNRSQLASRNRAHCDLQMRRIIKSRPGRVTCILVLFGDFETGLGVSFWRCPDARVWMLLSGPSAHGRATPVPRGAHSLEDYTGGQHNRRGGPVGYCRGHLVIWAFCFCFFRQANKSLFRHPVILCNTHRANNFISIYLYCGIPASLFCITFKYK